MAILSETKAKPWKKSARGFQVGGHFYPGPRGEGEVRASDLGPFESRAILHQTMIVFVRWNNHRNNTVPFLDFRRYKCVFWFTVLLKNGDTFPLIALDSALTWQRCGGATDCRRGEKKNALHLSVNVLSTKVLIGDTIFTSPTEDGNRISTLSSVCST